MNIIKESILSSSIRSFFKALFGFLGFFVGIILLIAIAGATMSPTQKVHKVAYNVLPDANGKFPSITTKAPVLLQINIEGEIGSKRLNQQIFRTLLESTKSGLLSKKTIKGILLTCNTPGGSVIDSDSIYNMLLAFKKEHNIPIHAHVNGLLASGGVYIACVTDYISATDVSIIGSVGVLSGPRFNYSGLMQKYGVESFTETRGKDKDALNPFRPWTSSDKEAYQNIIEYEYKRFVNLVANNRPKLTVDSLINRFGAHVFNSQLAKEYGYIDDNGVQYRDALKKLAAAAKVEKAYHVIEVTPIRSVVSELVDNDASILSKVFSFFFDTQSKHDSFNPRKHLKYLYRP